MAAAALAGMPRTAHAAPGRSVAIFGAGVAGLTAAHELVDRGFSVTVFERKALGGKARSIPVPNSGVNPLPAEHGFRFFPGFYRNVTDTMRRIPFPGNSHGVWQNLTRATSYLHSGLGRADLTIPLPFPLPDFAESRSHPRHSSNPSPRCFRRCSGCRPGRRPTRRRSWRSTSRAVTSARSGSGTTLTWEDYIGANKGSAEYNRYLGDGIIRNLAASKSRDASAHSIGLVGEASVWSILLLGNDFDNKGFDRVLNGPTSSQWLDPWVDHLRRRAWPSGSVRRCHG